MGVIVNVVKEVAGVASKGVVQGNGAGAVVEKSFEAMKLNQVVCFNLGSKACPIISECRDVMCGIA